MIRTYSELISIPAFEDRYEYLRLNGSVAEETFGFDRVFNQMFYQRSKEWKHVRNLVILRDTVKNDTLDLGCYDHPIKGLILVHHMNPIRLDDIQNSTDFLLDPEYLICVSMDTHNAIHYGDQTLLPQKLTERFPGDTCPWIRKE